jgi:uncharacterized protein
MTMNAAAPVARKDRISEIDVIRGFALFGVLWVNLLQHTDLAIPQEQLAALPTAPVDHYLNMVSRWLAQSKAQALFSLLFGFGFAIMMDRLDARGADGTRIYLRRLTILLAFGLAHLLLLWTGDILHMYALMGFLLLLTRHWPGWLLIGAGATLAVVGVPAIIGLEAYGYPGGQAPWIAEQVAGQARRWVTLQGSDYGAFVVENWRTIWSEVYSQPLGPLILGFVLGRFMIGAWIYRQGWLQDPDGNAAFFRKWTAILLPAGLLLGGVRLIQRFFEIEVTGAAEILLFTVLWIGVHLQALGYAAGLVLLCRNEKWRRRLSGLGAVGQMALTNYVMQSFFYVFILYGFGLGLLPWNGATFSLAFALSVFAFQIAFSRWWLKRYRFGPLEWAWRSLTYGERQKMRIERAGEPLPAAAE